MTCCIRFFNDLQIFKPTYYRNFDAEEFARDQIEPIVKNLKKGEVINGKATSKDLNALASTFGVKVDTITGASFSQTFVPKLGSEPNVLSANLVEAKEAVVQFLTSKKVP